MRLWLLLGLVALGIQYTTQNVISCKVAKKLLKQCVNNGYTATKIVGCVTRSGHSSADSDQCSETEQKLYRVCGYRHCPDWEPVMESETVSVASDNDECTKIGISAMKAGGSAVDAASSVLLCLGAVQPQSNGIGGGGFMLFHHDGQNTAINFRNTAPASASKDMFVEDSQLSVFGGKAVSVPGEIAGHFAAHQHFGRLNWEELFAPTIAMLREGIRVTAHMELALGVVKEELIKDRVARTIFFKDPEDAESHLREGDVFTNKRLAQAYEDIAEKGPRAFYRKNIARNIIKASDARGGILTLGDLKKYKVEVEEPMSVEYRSHNVLTTPSPSSGHVVSLILQLLDTLDISQNDTASYNKIIEAFRFGYAMRGQTGDKEYSRQTRKIIKKIRDGSYARKIIDLGHFKENKEGFIEPYSTPQQYNISGDMKGMTDDTHTTHVSIIGPGGDAVSVMSSVNTYFGSCVMTEDGIVLNNEMNDFSIPGVINEFGFPPAPENYIAPGKRAQSSASPLIALDEEGKVVFVSGAEGGSRIITSTLLSLIRGLDWDMSLEDNAAAPRVHDQLNMVTMYELGLDEEIVERLGELGYEMQAYPEGEVPSSVNSVSILRGYQEARGDPRKEGSGRTEEITN